LENPTQFIVEVLQKY